MRGRELDEESYSIGGLLGCGINAERGTGYAGHRVG